MQQQVLDTAPWWVPPDWQAVTLAILGGVVLTQVAKLAYRDITGRKPRRYLIVAVSVVITAAALTLFGWLEDRPFRYALRTGLMWGIASPLIWLAAQWVMRRYAPGLAAVVGEDRRQRQPEDEHTLFGDTTITDRRRR